MRGLVILDSSKLLNGDSGVTETRRCEVRRLEFLEGLSVELSLQLFQDVREF